MLNHCYNSCSLRSYYGNTGDTEHISYAAIYVNPLEKAMLQNAELNSSVLIGEDFTYQGNTIDLVEGEIAIGSFDVKVFEVPGHSPCGIALYIEKYLFCGDVLFAGSIGRTDFAGGDQRKLIEGIKTKLLTLPENKSYVRGIWVEQR